MNHLQQRALATVPLSQETVEDFYTGQRSGTADQCLKALCISHERLRAELQGAMALLEEDAGKSALCGLLTAAKEAMSWLRRLNDFEVVCRALIDTKIGQEDLAVILSNILRRLDRGVEQIERSLSPRELPQSDFESWMEETFCGRDHDVKMEAVPYAHLFTYEQTLQLANFVWSCVENKPPPWWSRFASLPALLAALEQIAAHDPETCDGITARDCLDAVREIARAALAKVKGETPC